MAVVSLGFAGPTWAALPMAIPRPPVVLTSLTEPMAMPRFPNDFDTAPMLIPSPVSVLAIVPNAIA